MGPLSASFHAFNFLMGRLLTPALQNSGGRGQGAKGETPASYCDPLALDLDATDVPGFLCNGGGVSLQWI